jgi:hypothetical protein
MVERTNRRSFDYDAQKPRVSAQDDSLFHLLIKRFTTVDPLWYGLGRNDFRPGFPYRCGGRLAA